MPVKGTSLKCLRGEIYIFKTGSVKKWQWEKEAKRKTEPKQFNLSSPIWQDSCQSVKMISAFIFLSIKFCFLVLFILFAISCRKQNYFFRLRNGRKTRSSGKCPISLRQIDSKYSFVQSKVKAHLCHILCVALWAMYNSLYDECVSVCNKWQSSNFIRTYRYEHKVWMYWYKRMLSLCILQTHI